MSIRRQMSMSTFLAFSWILVSRSDICCRERERVLSDDASEPNRHTSVGVKLSAGHRDKVIVCCAAHLCLLSNLITLFMLAKAFYRIFLTSKCLTYLSDIFHHHLWRQMGRFLNLLSLSNISTRQTNHWRKLERLLFVKFIRTNQDLQLEASIWTSYHSRSPHLKLIGPVIITTLFCSWKTEQIVARLDQEKRDYRYVIHLFTHTTHPIDSQKKNVLRIHKLQLPLLLCVSLTLLWICISTGRKSSTENRNRNVCNVHSSEYKQHQQ